MKKQRRMLLSMLCVMVLVFQLILPAASAERAKSVSGEEPLAVELHVPDSARLDELLEDESFAIKLGDVDLMADEESEVQLKDLMSADLTVAAPSGYWISGLYLRGADTEAAAKSLLPDAGSEPTAVTLDKEGFLDDDGAFDKSVLSSFADAEDPAYALAVYFVESDTEAGFTVSYDMNGVADEPAAESGSFGSAFTVPDLPDQQKSAARDAQKVFNGWVLRYADGSRLEVAPGDLIAPHADCTLEAQWGTICTVSFESNGGSAVDPQTVNQGDTASEPEDPTRDGHSFAGWFSDEALNTPYTFSAAVNEDITLYAAWTENTRATVTVSFDSNGGSAVDPQTIDQGATPSKPEDPTRDGHSFAGWYSDKALNTPYTFSTAVSEDITLYAAWTENPQATVTVSFDSNGGSAVDPQTIDRGATPSKPEDPTRDGHSFAGWYSDKALNTPFTFSTAVSEDITLYAAWTENAPGGDEPLTPTVIDLSIEAVTAEKTYDGTPLKAAEYNDNGYTNGYKHSALADGHKLEGVSVSGEALTPGDPVPVTLDTSALKITDADGKDVTASYQITTADGSLTIHKRSLVLTAVSDSKEYTGQLIKASELEKEGFDDGCSIGGDGLVSGHTMSAITVSGEGKDAGTYVTQIEDPSDITVSSGNEDVTECYDISAVDGSLEITRRTITITAISGTVTETGKTIYAKNYSGNGYTHGYKSEGLLDGHTLEGDFVTGSGLDVSFDTGIDAKKVQILDEKGNDVTKNYAIKTVAGRMKVKGQESTQTGITVTASAKKVYDATPLTIKNSDIKVTQGTLPSNYTLEASFGPTTSITDVQKISVNLSNVKIKDANGKDVTSQFKITAVSGTMEVTKKPLTLTAESDSKTYDGAPLINKNVRATALASKNHTLSVEYEITNSDGNVIKNGAVNVGTYTKKITSVTIKEGSKDVTSNYSITTVDGKLTITAGSTKKNDGTNPKTGDDRNIGLWLGIVIVSAVFVLAILLILVLRAKKKQAPKSVKAKPRKKE